jgi:chitin disaccharide deacetylase
VRRLIINADDLGLTPGVNRAIVHGHREGILTSTTLMAGGAAFAEAAEMARSQVRLSVGCHVVLLDGKALSGAANTLSPDGGELRPSLLRFAAAVKSGRIAEADMEHEAIVQIRRVQKAGLSPSHLDTHKHAHMLPEVARPLLRAARECGVGAVRNPFEPLRAVPWRLLARRPRKWLRLARVLRMSTFAAGFRRMAAEAGLRTPDGTLGIVLTGSLDLEALRATVVAMPEGTWELVCHPGYHDPDLDSAGTWLRASRGRELELLTSPAARECLQQSGVELISYRELAA